MSEDPAPGRSREIRAVWGPGLGPIVAGSGGDDFDADVYGDLWPDPAAAEAAAEAQVRKRAVQITGQFSGYRPPRWQVSAAAELLSISEVYEQLYGEDGS